MKTLGIDIETFSGVDIKKAGMYKYAEAPYFEILLFAYSIDSAPAVCVDIHSGEQLPKEVMAALTDPAVLKTAHNAGFERTCIGNFFYVVLPAEQWECTMAKGAQLGLPLALAEVSKVLKLVNSKMVEGKKLIRQFCIPCKPTAKNGLRTRNLPAHDPESWAIFKQYCAADVDAEQEIRKRIQFFEIPEMEKKLWILDQKINDRGILVDRQLVRNAISIDAAHRRKLEAEAIEITGLSNPNSAAQLKKWLEEETGEDVAKLRKEDIPEILKTTEDEKVKRVLGIRQEMAKTSVKKYAAIENVVDANDDRVRGLMQYYGANRTGRWAGRLVQVQNLPKNKLKDLDLARQLVLDNDAEMLEMLFGNVPDTLSQLIRTAFIAPPGHRFLVSDFSAIEARVIAWLAGEQWRLDVFNTHGKIYEASGAAMFKVPIEQVTEGSDLRDKAKIAELALGFGGGPDALLKMGAKKMGLKEDELPKLVAMWRNANKKITAYWKICGNAAVEAVETGKPVTISHGIKFAIDHTALFITLPSKRRLVYLKPMLEDGMYGKILCYDGMNQTTKQWGRQYTYGGKIVENIVQATARDCLANGLLNLDSAGYKLVFHVHDEAVPEMPYGEGSLDEVNKIMGAPIPWAKGLPMNAKSYETEYYKKD